MPRKDASVSTESPKPARKNEKKQEPVTSNEDVAADGKLQAIDREIRILFEFCKDNGYKHTEIEKAASPLLKEIRSSQIDRWKKILLKSGQVIGIALMILMAMYYISPIYRLIIFLARKSSIQILPWWDWTKLYNEQCLIQNPYFQGDQELLDEDCIACESLESIPRMKNISLGIMTESYLKGSSPVIITDGMEDWDRINDLSITALDTLYHEDSVLHMYMACQFMSNIRIKHGNQRALLRKAASGELTSYFAHWENCFKEAAKSFRQLYRRPYFLPPMVQLDDTNWVFISANFKAKKFKSVETGNNMFMVAQVRGHLDVQVVSHYPCSKICRSLSETLNPGEILIVPEFLWRFEYKPTGEDESITFGVAGSFD